jgi:cytochrome c-type biogenesis protein
LERTTRWRASIAAGWPRRSPEQAVDPSDPAGVSVLTAFGAGLISFLSPCVLPLVPGYLSAVTGVTPDELGEAGWRRVLPPALLFCASFSAIFVVILGLPASLIGEALREHRDLLNTIGGILIIVMGVLFVVSSSGRFAREWRVDALMARAGKGGPLIAGAAFALAWTPCIGPTLTSILLLAGTEGSADGVALLIVYSLGLAIPFIGSAIAFNRATTVFGAVKRHYGLIVGLGGAVLIGMGILMLTGGFTELNIEAQKITRDLGLDF